METGGTVRESGQQYEVTGESWMDKEFSSAFLSDQQTGWDWFSLRLEDGRSLMLYQLRRESGSIDFRGGTVIGPGSAVRYLEEDGWTAQPDDWWTSPTTAGRYPISWKVQVPTLELDLRVEADFPNQENVSRLIPSLAYWEGSVKIHQDGRLAGRGYLELTGYVPGGRLPLQAGGD
jgi:predicted secreted hydrolase